MGGVDGRVRAGWWWWWLVGEGEGEGKGETPTSIIVVVGVSGGSFCLPLFHDFLRSVDVSMRHQ